MHGASRCSDKVQFDESNVSGWSLLRDTGVPLFFLHPQRLMPILSSLSNVILFLLIRY